MEGLTFKQRRAVEGLLDGLNIQDAAGRAGVNRKTVSRWLGEPAFWNAYRTASDAALQTTARRLAANLDGAVDVLVAVRDDESAPAGVRLRAADKIIQAALKALDMVDFATRLDELERRLGEL